MSGYNIDIADMQCWVFRMAQAKWKMAPSDCAELFKREYEKISVNKILL